MAGRAHEAKHRLSRPTCLHCFNGGARRSAGITGNTRKISCVAVEIFRYIQSGEVVRCVSPQNGGIIAWPGLDPCDRNFSLFPELHLCACNAFRPFGMEWCGVAGAAGVGDDIQGGAEELTELNELHGYMVTWLDLIPRLAVVFTCAICPSYPSDSILVFWSRMI